MITIVPSLLVVPSDKGNANSGNENVTVAVTVIVSKAWLEVRDSVIRGSHLPNPEQQHPSSFSRTGTTIFLTFIPVVSSGLRNAHGSGRMGLRVITER